MDSIQERLVIKSGLWWCVYGTYMQLHIKVPVLEEDKVYFYINFKANVKNSRLDFT